VIADGLATLRDIHQTWAWVVIVSNAVAGLWALGANWLQPIRGRALWWYIGAAQVTVVVQAFIGAAMVGKYKVPLPQFHAFYGFFAIITIAIIYSYRFQMKHRLYLLYGFGSLFVMGLAIRAMLLAPSL
jgi:heme A synthase